MSVDENETERKLKVGTKEKKEASDEGGMKVPPIAHMHFKEGRSFAVPSPQREQNEISLQDAFKINTQTEKVYPKAGFSVCCEQTAARVNNGCG